MKIKTIFKPLDNGFDDDFDTEVNAALAEGWQLVKREVLPGHSYNPTNWAKRILYAELVMPDAPEEAAPFDYVEALAQEAGKPAPLNPFKALAAIRAFCEARTCAGCPLDLWCQAHLANKEGPADWKLPGEVPQA